MARVSFTLRRTDSEKGSYLRYDGATAYTTYGTAGASGDVPERADFDLALRSDGIQTAPPELPEAYFDATSTAYGEVDLTWSTIIRSTVPSSPGVTGVVVVYSPRGEPQTIASGDILVEANDTYSYSHTGLTEGRWAYYSLFLHYQSSSGDSYYERAASLAVLVPRNFGSTLMLWNRVPEYYRIQDTALGDTFFDPAIGSVPPGGVIGPLFKYLSIIGFEIDRIRTTIDYQMGAYDPALANTEHLDAIAEQMAVVLRKSDLGGQRLRTLLGDIGYFRRSKGTPSGTEFFGKAVSGSVVSLNTVTGGITVFSQRVNYITVPKTGIGITAHRAAHSDEAVTPLPFFTGQLFPGPGVFPGSGVFPQGSSSSFPLGTYTLSGSAFTPTGTGASSGYTHVLISLNCPVPVKLGERICFSVQSTVGTSAIKWARLVDDQERTVGFQDTPSSVSGARAFEITATSNASAGDYVSTNVEYLVDLSAVPEFNNSLLLAERNYLGSYFDGDTVRGGWLIDSSSVSDYRWSGSANSSCSIFAEDYERTKGIINELLFDVLPINQMDRYHIVSYNAIVGLDDATPPPALAWPVIVPSALYLDTAFSAASAVDPTNSFIYTWNFGDGTTGTGVSVTHTYAAPGTYTVTLLVNDSGTISTTSTVVTVSSAPDTTPEVTLMTTFPTMPSAPGNVYYVSPTGDDTNPGTLASPWLTFAKAYESVNASGGDTVYFRAGTYQTSLSLTRAINGSASMWTVFRGYGIERPKFTNVGGSWETIRIKNASYIMFRQMEFDGTGALGELDMLCIDDATHHVSIWDVWAHDAAGCGIAVAKTVNFDIRNCRIYNNSKTSVYGQSGLNVVACLNPTSQVANGDGYHNYIIGNVVWDNNQTVASSGFGSTVPTSGNGINVSVGGTYAPKTLVANNVTTNNGGKGIFVSSSNNVDVVNNTCWRDGWARLDGAMRVQDSSNINVANNAFIGAAGYRAYTLGTNPGTVTSAYNAVSGTGDTAVGTGSILVSNASTMIVNPQLAPLTGDWRALPPLTGVGAATPISGVSAPTVDAYGTTRSTPPSIGVGEGTEVAVTPTASFTASMSLLVGSFDGSASSSPGSTISTYAWTFGDGTTGTGATPSKTYTTAGTYIVALTVTDALGRTASTSQTVTATTPPVVVGGTGLLSSFPAMPPAPGNVYYVSPSGNDSNPGTFAAPWRTFAKAMLSVDKTGGDTVYFRAGTYQGAFNYTGSQGPNGSASRWTVFQGYGNERPKFTNVGGSWEIVKFSYMSYIMFRQMEFDGTSSAGELNGLNIDRGCHHIKVWDVWAHHCPGSGIAALMSTNIDIRNCRVWNCAITSIYGQSGINLIVLTNIAGQGADSGGYHNYIIGNVVWDCRQDVVSSGIGLYYATDGNGIIVDNNMASNYTGTTLVANNITANNGGRGIHVMKSKFVDVINNTCWKDGWQRHDGALNIKESNTIRIANNVAVGAAGYRGYYQVGNTGSISSAYNGSAGSGDSPYSGTDFLISDANNIYINPQLTPMTGNWHAKTALLGRGRTTPIAGLNAPTVDTYGTTRPNPPSAGASEA